MWSPNISDDDDYDYGDVDDDDGGVMLMLGSDEVNHVGTDDNISRMLTMLMMMLVRILVTTIASSQCLEW